mmetsp:Transcript_85167/g.241326  ORF Transcript_85167/g.241326 Transcript_85167/m.241326 type:complete len:213 (-) Transcript_85167:325-963(-)
MVCSGRFSKSATRWVETADRCNWMKFWLTRTRYFPNLEYTLSSNTRSPAVVRLSRSALLLSSTYDPQSIAMRAVTCAIHSVTHTLSFCRSRAAWWWVTNFLLSASKLRSILARSRMPKEKMLSPCRANHASVSTHSDSRFARSINSLSVRFLLRHIKPRVMGTITRTPRVGKKFAERSCSPERNDLRTAEPNIKTRVRSKAKRFSHIIKACQ